MATFSTANGDIVGTWLVPLQDGLYTVQFEHGTVTGKRVVTVNGQPVVSKKMQFRLVGSEDFPLGEHKCSITIQPFQNMSYAYNLKVDGVEYEKFLTTQRESLRFWRPALGDGTKKQVILDKDSMDVFVNGKQMQTTDEFCDDGAMLHFMLGDTQPARIRMVNSGTTSSSRSGGIEFFLIVGDTEYAPNDLLSQKKN